ncbi:twin-arginine translocase subunit TatC [Paraphotobacterium marinum]|uniref:Sec-independent protein translocase protein TatC n=2 Tax=Paraphotobacterium marinum TaxID=1755811 RepID=A0A220VD03_9GAMM|nr:twin-arginine translocase subunit TatC [Paraphotobacterium marinum]
MSYLEQMRYGIIKAFIFFLFTSLICVFFSKEIFEIVSIPLNDIKSNGSPLIAIGVTSPLLIPLKVAFCVSFLLTLPIILFQIWVFISPALYKNEKIFFCLIFTFIVVLFYGGFLFSFLIVMPQIIYFIGYISPDIININTDVERYFSFIYSLSLCLSLCFQVPVIMMLLAWFNQSILIHFKKFRSYVFVACFIIAMLLTPPDVLTQILIGLPLYLLYELGLLLSLIIFKLKKNVGEIN